MTESRTSAPRSSVTESTTGNSPGFSKRTVRRIGEALSIVSSPSISSRYEAISPSGSLPSASTRTSRGTVPVRGSTSSVGTGGRFGGTTSIARLTVDVAPRSSSTIAVACQWPGREHEDGVDRRGPLQCQSRGAQDLQPVADDLPVRVVPADPHAGGQRRLSAARLDGEHSTGREVGGLDCDGPGVDGLELAVGDDSGNRIRSGSVGLEGERGRDGAGGAIDQVRDRERQLARARRDDLELHAGADLDPHLVDAGRDAGQARCVGGIGSAGTAIRPHGAAEDRRENDDDEGNSTHCGPRWEAR